MNRHRAPLITRAFNHQESVMPIRTLSPALVSQTSVGCDTAARFPFGAVATATPFNQQE
ncbi:hypothetical protein ACSZNV_12130 [Aeromonas hydrophila]|uniref:hypothetical protein n=1 Tax=Aeromonas hydrophila TaxID=644 RepID=UPI001CC7C1FF|nr:hypothetical protein [Aeromonas hydrophila]